MINGEIVFPRKIPNLNQILFKGVKILEFKNPKNKKIKEINSDQSLIFSLFNNGYKHIRKKIIEKTTPKFLLDGMLIYLLLIIT